MICSPRTKYKPQRHAPSVVLFPVTPYLPTFITQWINLLIRLHLSYSNHFISEHLLHCLTHELLEDTSYLNHKRSGMISMVMSLMGDFSILRDMIQRGVH